MDSIGGLDQAVRYAAAEASLTDYEVRVIPKPKDFATRLLEYLSAQSQQPAGCLQTDPFSLLNGESASGALLGLLWRTDRQRFQVLCQALHRVELCGQGVVMMTFEDMMFRTGEPSLP